MPACHHKNFHITPPDKWLPLIKVRTIVAHADLEIADMSV